MKPDRELSKKEQKEVAEEGVAEKICADLIPHLFYDAEGKTWAHLLVDGHFETYAIQSQEMSTYLEHLFWEEMERSCGKIDVMPPKLLKKQLGLLRAMALHKGEEKKVSLRVGATSSRVLYIDLGDKERTVVRISPDGWELDENPPVFFRRTHDMLALPIPERSGSPDELRPYLNVSSEDEFTLVQGWILSALRSYWPYPVMVLIGPAGSAKSSFTRILRDLTDPDKNPYSGSPYDHREFKVAALNSHVLAYDNLSRLGTRVSDALCRQASGGGGQERKYRTNNQEIRFPFRANPIILNGVPAFVTRPDLLDRCIMLHLPHLDTKKTEAALRREYEAKRGRIFGGFLNLMVQGVRNLPNVQSESSLRMVEAIKWCMACGLEDFEDCFGQNQKDSNQASIEHNPLAIGIRALMETEEQWMDNAETLGKTLTTLGYIVPEKPLEISNELREIAPQLLKGYGIKVEFRKRKNNLRPILITKHASRSSPPDEDK
jgi:hypothetical protein